LERFVARKSLEEGMYVVINCRSWFSLDYFTELMARKPIAQKASFHVGGDFSPLL
jgi:hypothetical protein